MRRTSALSAHAAQEFVTSENLSRAYEWHHLNIGFGVTITGAYGGAHDQHVAISAATKARDRHRLGYHRPICQTSQTGSVDRDHSGSRQANPARSTIR